LDLFRGAESLMRMDDRTWSRHANPWSVYTRIASSLPLFLAIWSIHWIGWWSVLPIGIISMWIFVNPRFFPAPSSAKSWAASGVLGERAFLNRKRVPIPHEHLVFAYLTSGLGGLFLLVTIWGIVSAAFWLALTSWLAVVVSKVWFVDRMAWLWQDVKDAHPVYQAWDDADWSKTF